MANGDAGDGGTGATASPSCSTMEGSDGDARPLCRPRCSCSSTSDSIVLWEPFLLHANIMSTDRTNT